MLMRQPTPDARAITADRWLSDMLGRPAWKVDGGTADPAEVVARAGNGFFFTRISADEVSALHRFESAGFRVIDMTVTLEARMSGFAGTAPRPGVRQARPSDQEAVKELASRSFRWSRLHLDPAVPKAIADRSRAEWVGNFFAGIRGNALVVAEQDQRLAAFLLLLGPANGLLTIDLIAVDPDRRRHGLGAACIGYAADHSGRAETLHVATQAANVGSLRFYESLGFRTISTQYVLHLHRG
jgi:ribosomal protein S18 acetylase RimI-like enzyme